MIRMRRLQRKILGLVVVLATGVVAAATPEPAFSSSRQTDAPIPGSPLKAGIFTAWFDPDGEFRVEGDPEMGGIRWPPLAGSWRMVGDEIELLLTAESAGVLVSDFPVSTSGGPMDCDRPGRYRLRIDDDGVSFDHISDDCTPRRMILAGSAWRPSGEPRRTAARRIVRTAGALPAPAHSDPSGTEGSWPSFRGPLASGVGERQNLPDNWDGETGKNILWRKPIPGLAHSSPIVWGDKIFLTTAVGSDPGATFRPGLYGDGDPSDDRSHHRWKLYALDKRSGKGLWERVVHEGVPIDRRHIKATYANSTPATDGRIVVAWFGSQGVYAYDVEGRFLWKVDLGRLNLGPYAIPNDHWGPASSPIIWGGLVFLQCDTQEDSFILALDLETGEPVWKKERDEFPSWSTPTVAITSKGPELVVNGSNYVTGYDPRTGQELWRVGPSSKITAPTPIFADDFLVVVSGFPPERPIFVVRAGARGDLTLPEGKTSSEAIAWSRTARGSYMPTPLIYKGILYLLNNNGVLDAYNLRTGEEIYRQRLPLVGSGYSASPVAADGKLYFSNEDGEILVVTAGEEFHHVATNLMGELLMATPALSDGVMYVRSSKSLFAVGRSQ